MLSAMKILVSGSHGLVGKALTHSLTDDGHEVAVAAAVGAERQVDVQVTHVAH